MNDIDDFTIPEEIPEPPAEKRTEPRKIVPEFEHSSPASIDAEKSILGAILLDNTAYHEATESLSADDFYLDSHRRIFSVMAALFEEQIPVDIVTLSEELSKRKEVGSIGGIAYLVSLTEGLPRRLSITEYVRIVKDKSLLRQLISICTSTITRAADQSETSLEVFDAAEQQFVGLRDQSKTLFRKKFLGPFFLGYRSFVSTAPEEVEWTVDGLIQKDGNGLILGDSGTSKSLVVFDLALHMVAGVAWFGCPIRQRIKVGLVAREDAPGLSQSRLQRLRDGAAEGLTMFLDCIDLEDWLYINTRSQRETWSLQSESDIQDIVESTKERGINFLFFDVFRDLWEGNENDNQETAKVLAAAKRISREASCQVCIVHHLSKSDRGTIFDRARGGGINGWKEWGFGLTVENPDAEPKDQIRKIQFHTKAACSSSPIYYRIDGMEQGLRLEQVESPASEYKFDYSKKSKKKDSTEPQRLPYQD